ncbi:hypothetical protein G7Y79_00001g004560 [Physcia stellaris]|nr:hypothetical protein G7Y79_00001g004560 [Physcia stellaris]
MLPGVTIWPSAEWTIVQSSRVLPLIHALTKMATESAPQPHVFQQLDEYPWDSDKEFQSGLHAILGSGSSPDQAEYLTLRAKCFYYSRKTHVGIDFDAYRLWRSQHRLQTTEGTSNPQKDIIVSNIALDASASPTLEVSPAQPSANEDAAPYPTSFSQIVDLITSGQPVPGIKEIPDTVLSGKESNPKSAKRKKPWENAAEQNEKVAGDAKS